MTSARVRRFVVAAFLIVAAMPARAETLRVGVDGDAYPPFSTKTDSGEWGGFDVDIARALCAEMGIECEWVRRGRDALLSALINDECDFVVASLTASRDRKKLAAFSKPYYRNGAKFLRKRGDKRKIAYKKMAGVAVGVRDGGLYDNFLSKEFKGVVVKRYPTIAHAREALRDGDVEFVLADRFSQSAWAAQNDGYEVAGPTYTTVKYFKDAAVAVRKGDKALRERINAGIRALRDNGGYQTINDNYFAFDAYK